MTYREMIFRILNHPEQNINLDEQVTLKIGDDSFKITDIGVTEQDQSGAYFRHLFLTMN